MNISKKTANYYDRFARYYGNSLKTVNWSSRKNQELRFQQFLPFLPQTYFTINDIGCGLGDFLLYLNKHRTANFHYTGYDLSTNMIDLANKNIRSDNVRFDQIEDLNQMAEADYSIASGTFNKRFLFPSKTKYVKHFYQSINTMAAKSKKGFGFNFLSDVDKPRFYDGLLYLNKAEVLAYGKQKFGDQVTLIEDYHKIDVTFWWTLD